MCTGDNQGKLEPLNEEGSLNYYCLIAQVCNWRDIKLITDNHNRFFSIYKEIRDNNKGRYKFICSVILNDGHIKTNINLICVCQQELMSDGGAKP